MNSDDLQFVLVLCEEGTLAAAGKRLGVSHTTVARRIYALEEELGCRLFVKTARKQVLTPAGEEVVGVARRVQAELATLDRQVLGRDARLSGPLKVTTIDAVLFHHARELAAFREQYPLVELEIAIDNRTQSLSKRGGGRRDPIHQPTAGAPGRSQDRPQ